MDGDELIRKLRKVGKLRGVAVRFDPAPGKGSHGALWYGAKRTTIKDRKKEIGPGLLHEMLAQLGLTKDDLQQP